MSDSDPIGGEVQRIRGSRRLWWATGAMAVISVLLMGWLFVDSWRDSRALTVDNRSGQIVVVNAHTDGLDWYTGEIEVAAHSSGTLRSSDFWLSPDSIYITEMYAFPQRQWACRWDEVSAKSGLVWTDEGANCGERRQ